MGRGAILFPADFADAGSAEVVKKVLLRLEHQGFLKRLAFGIYLYPKQSKLLGSLTPSLEEIAKAIAQRDADAAGIGAKAAVRTAKRCHYRA